MCDAETQRGRIYLHHKTKTTNDDETFRYQSILNTQQVSSCSCRFNESELLY